MQVENTIRWRPVKDEQGNDKMDDFGQVLRESNARFVKWSDGRCVSIVCSCKGHGQLQVKCARDCSMSLHLGGEVFDVYTMQLQGDFNHLFVRQGTGLQGQAIFKTKLTFRPHSTDSFTHRKMTMSLADKNAKKQKLKVLPIAGVDPESQRSEMIKVRAHVRMRLFMFTWCVHVIGSSRRRRSDCARRRDAARSRSGRRSGRWRAA